MRLAAARAAPRRAAVVFVLKTSDALNSDKDQLQWRMEELEQAWLGLQRTLVSSLGFTQWTADKTAERMCTTRVKSTVERINKYITAMGMIQP